jgi:uncharacterized protein YjdB
MRKWLLAGTVIVGLLVLSCNLSDEHGHTFIHVETDSTWVAFDSLQIEWKDNQSGEHGMLFHGQPSKLDSLNKLPADGYQGQKIDIVVRGFSGKVVAHEEVRHFDGKDANLIAIDTLIYKSIVYTTESLRPIVITATALSFAARDTQVTEGDSVPLPLVNVTPEGLLDKSVTWFSTDSQRVILQRGRYFARKPGMTQLWVRLQSNPTKQIGFAVEVIGRKFIAQPDSLRLSPDTLPLALKGAPGRFSVKVYPPTLECPFKWSSLDTGIAQITTAGIVIGIREGRGRIRIACSETDSLADTAWLEVTGPVKVDSLRFLLDSLDIYAGGAGESLMVKAYPPLANQEFELTVQNPLIAEWSQGKLKGLKAGRTTAIGRSKQDSLKVDTLRLNVIASQPIDSVVLIDSITIFTKSESQILKAKVYPANYSQEVVWRTLAPSIASVDVSGKSTAVKPGRTYFIAISHVDSTRRDSTLVIVKKDTPLLTLGADTTISLGASLVFFPKVYQEYGRIVRFKWDLNGDGLWDDSVVTLDSLKAPLTYRYDTEQEIQARFYIKDSEGNDTLAFKKVKAVKGPVILFLAPADQSDTNQMVIEVEWSVDGVLQTNFTRQLLVTGPNVVARKAKDATGKEFSASITVYLDTLPPGKPDLHSFSPVNTQVPTWIWTRGGGGNGTFRYRLDDQDMTGATPTLDTVFTPAKKLSEDLHTLFVQEQDAAGNWSAIARFAVQVDLTPPSLPMVEVLVVSPSKESKPSWTWKSGGADGIGVFRYRLDSSDLSRGTTQGTERSYTSLDSLRSGEHVLYVQERDLAGNWSPSGNAKVMLDLIAPKAPAVSVSPIGPTNIPRPIWKWASEDGTGTGTFRYRLDSSDMTVGALTGTALTFTPDHDLTSGEHRLFVQERDEAGNWSASGSAKVRLDLLKPSSPIVNFSPSSPMRNTRPKWTWTSGGNGGSGLFRYGLEAGILTRLIEGSATEFTPISDMISGEVIFYVQEKDSVGNWSDTTVTRLWIDLIMPNTPVISVLPQSPLNSLRPTWNWISGGNGGMGTYRCKLDDSHLETGSTIVSSGRFTPDQDLIEGLHTLYAQESDSAGNWSESATKSTQISLRKVLGNGALASARGDYISMVNYGGTPYVAFADNSLKSRATVMRLLPNKLGWEVVGGAGFTVGPASHLAFAISPAGRPYIAFQDSAHGAKVTVMRLNSFGTGWEIYGGAGISIGYAQFISMAINNAGIPFVCYMDDSQGNKLTVMQANATGTGWVSVANRSFSPEAASNPSLALNSAGVPYVSFTNGILSASGLVMRPNSAGTNWETVGGASFSPGNVASTRMIFNNADVPHVVFSDGTNSNSASLRRLNTAGTAWETVGNIGFSTPWCNRIGIVFDSLDLPYVAYADGNAGNRATMKHLNATKSGWDIVGKAGFTTGEAVGISLAIASNGVPYIAFGDGADGIRPTVMTNAFDP